MTRNLDRLPAGLAARRKTIGWCAVKDTFSPNRVSASRFLDRTESTGFCRGQRGHRLDKGDPDPHARQERQASSVVDLWKGRQRPKKPGPSLL